MSDKLFTSGERRYKPSDGGGARGIVEASVINTAYQEHFNQFPSPYIIGKV
jgi:hypothetical protein